MYNEDLQELYHVTWRPQSTTLHPLEHPLHPMPTPHASALRYLGTVKTPSKSAGAYRPPGARGQLTPLAFKREDEGGAAYVSNGSLSLGLGAAKFGQSRKRDVPGAEAVADDAGGAAAAAAAAEGDENLSKAAAKNKKKREAKRAKDVAEKAAGLVPDGSANNVAPSPNRSPEQRSRKGHERNPSSGRARGLQRSQDKRREPRSPEKQASASRATAHTPPATNGTSKQAAPEAPDLTVTSPGGGGNPQDKKIRALLKKLRAIDDLKMRRAGGEKLEGTQKKKMETEDEVRKELGGLGWKEE